MNEEVRAFEIDEIDTHCSGNSVWDITPESIVKETENGGMLVLAKKHESCEGGVVLASGDFSLSESGEKNQSESNEMNQSPGFVLLN